MANNKVVKMESKKTKKKEPINFEGFISKIKIDKKSDVPEIHYRLENDKRKAITILNGKERALDSFIAAMQNLASVYCEMCEFTERENYVIITTVNFSEKGGVIISGQVELGNGIPQPLCVNSPHVLINSEGGSYELPESAREQLDELKREAVSYINGDRKDKQATLPLEAENG